MTAEFRLDGPQAAAFATKVAETLTIEGIQAEVRTEKQEQFDQSALGSYQETFELLRVVVVPSGLALILRAIAKVCEARAKTSPKIKIQIDKRSIELSGRMTSEERSAVVTAFLERFEGRHQNTTKLEGCLTVVDEP
jgi:hypothetical protein